MPLKGARYRYKKGTKTRLAFKGGQVVEAKNMETGATHTPAEFARDRENAPKMLKSSHRKVGY